MHVLPECTAVNTSLSMFFWVYDIRSYYRGLHPSSKFVDLVNTI